MAANGSFNGNPCVSCLDRFAKEGTVAGLKNLCLFPPSPEEEDKIPVGTWVLKCLHCKNRSSFCYQAPDAVKNSIRAVDARRKEVLAMPAGKPQEEAVAELQQTCRQIYVRIQKHFPKFQGVGNLHCHRGARAFDQSGPYYDAEVAKDLWLADLERKGTPLKKGKKGKNPSNLVPATYKEAAAEEDEEIVALRTRAKRYAAALKKIKDAGVVYGKNNAGKTTRLGKYIKDNMVEWADEDLNYETSPESE